MNFETASEGGMANEARSQTDIPALLIGAGVAAAIILVGLGIVIGRVTSEPETLSRSGESSPRASASAFPDQAEDSFDSTAECAAASPEAGGWQYSRLPDAIRGGYTEYAVLRSDPNFGASHHSLQLVLTMQQGRPVSAEIESSDAVLCLPSECLLPMAFDGKRSAMAFRFTTNGVRSLSPADFMSRIKRALEVIVEVPTAEFGSLQFRFDVSGFAWKLAQATPASAPPSTSVYPGPSDFDFDGEGNDGTAEGKQGEGG